MLTSCSGVPQNLPQACKHALRSRSVLSLLHLVPPLPREDKNNARVHDTTHAKIAKAVCPQSHLQYTSIGNNYFNDFIQDSEGEIVIWQPHDKLEEDAGRSSRFRQIEVFESLVNIIPSNLHPLDGRFVAPAHHSLFPARRTLRETIPRGANP